MASTYFSFDKLLGSQTAGYSSINTLIDSIDSVLNTRLPFVNNTAYAALGAGDAGKVVRWSGTAFAATLVNAASIDTGAVVEAKIGTGAVTEGKIGTGAVTADKLASTLDLTSKTVSVAAPNASAHAATKSYVDTTVSGGSNAWATNSTITAAGITSNNTVTATNGFTGNVTGNVNGSAASATNATTSTVAPLLRATANTGNAYITASANALTVTGSITGNINGNADTITGSINATNQISAGTLASARLSGNYSININGTASSLSSGGTSISYSNNNAFGNAGAWILGSGENAQISGGDANFASLTTNPGGIWSTTTLRSSTGNNTTANQSAAYFSANGVLGGSRSSIRFKKNVATHSIDKDAFLNLRPVTFNWKPEMMPEEEGSPELDRTIVGLIAEEVDESGLTSLVKYDLDNEPVNIDWNAVIASLISVCKEQQVEIDNLKARVEALEA